MAKSGSFNTGSYTGTSVTRYLVFSWEEVSQSVENNTTTISWKLTGGGTSGYMVCSDFEVVIDGEAVYSKDHNYHVDVYRDTVIASGTKVITHNADGTRNFTASVEAGIFVHKANRSGSGTFKLDTIPRASQPSLVTWPETTNDVGDFGDTISIHMNRNSDAFTHTVRYAFGSLTGTIATKVATGTTWTIPLDFMDLLPAATSGSGLIYVDTYNGSTLIGTKYTGFTATVPASVKPSCTFTLDDTTGADDIYGSPVKGLSKIKVTVTATKAYSSPIESITVDANGVKYSGSPVTTAALTKAGTSRVTVTVKDKRGRTGTSYYDMTVQDYAAPAVTALEVHRCNADGTNNDQGNYVKATFSAAVSSMSSKNTASYTLKYKKSSATSWTSVSLSALANKYSVANYEYVVAADGSSAYDITVTATDRHSAASRSTSASTAFTLMNFHASGTGMGVGKVCEKENTLQIALDVEFLGAVSGAIFDAILPVGSMVLRYDHINPGTLYPGTTWVRVENAFPWFTVASGTIGQTGGERTVTLTTAQLPAHSHGSVYSQHASGTKDKAWYNTSGTSVAYGAVSTGGGEAHNNMPPYIQISAWRRTA